MRARLAIESMKALATAGPEAEFHDEIYFVPVGVAEWIFKDAVRGRIGRGRDVLALPERIIPPGGTGRLHGGLLAASGADGSPLKTFTQDLWLSGEGGSAYGHRFAIEFLVCEQHSRDFAALIAISKLLAGGGFMALYDGGPCALEGVVESVRAAIRDCGDRVVGGFRVNSYRGLPGGRSEGEMAEISWQAAQETRLLGGEPALSGRGSLYDLALPARSTARFSVERPDAHLEFAVSVEVTGQIGVSR
jgi:hypothetical protein